MESIKCCDNCRKDNLFERCTRLNENEEFRALVETVMLKEGLEEYDAWFADEPLEFTERHICDDFENKYIEYPLTVSDIETVSKLPSFREKHKGKFVKIKPCHEKYDGKTYLGLYLGELPTDHRISHNTETQKLRVAFECHPAIFVFDLNEIMYGYQSWWGVIENEEQLKEISDFDIENTWYVKALNSLK